MDFFPLNFFKVYNFFYYLVHVVEQLNICLIYWQIVILSFCFTYPINITAVYLFFGILINEFFNKQVNKLKIPLLSSDVISSVNTAGEQQQKIQLPFKNSEETEWDLLKESNQNSGQRTLELFLASQGYPKIGLLMTPNRILQSLNQLVKSLIVAAKLLLGTVHILRKHLN